MVFPMLSSTTLAARNRKSAPWKGSLSSGGFRPAASGAFDSLVSNRRRALWDAGLGIRPSKNSQRAFSGAVNGDVPGFTDFSAHDKMAGEYRVMGIYPRGHLMEFVRRGLDSRVLPATAVDCVAEGEEVLVAGWPIARQHPKGQDGTVFVTIEDEKGIHSRVPMPAVHDWH